MNSASMKPAFPLHSAEILLFLREQYSLNEKNIQPWFRLSLYSAILDSGGLYHRRRSAPGGCPG
jgi:hypothetical protein